MPYIGNQPAEQFTSFATQTFSVSATTSYTLDHAVTNENEIALFVNNVRQHPGSGKAYTATGTALTLSAATASTDTMYCVFLGRALQTVTPATNSITNAMITDNTIESGKLFSTFKNGITMADQFRVTANITSNTDPISSNLERIDTTGQGTLGTGMSVSSGRFTFPSTGIYLVSFNGYGMVASGGDNIGMEIKVTTNNSSYSTVAYNYCGNQGGKSFSVGGNSLIDVTDTANAKVSFCSISIDSGSYFNGDTSGTSNNETYFTFIRLGDT